MASFGGAVKLTGESEYRAALRNITQNLREVSSEMKLVASQYDRGDTSTEALSAKSEVLNKKLEQQKSKLATLQAQYGKMSEAYQTNAQKHEKLVESYEQEKEKLDRIGQELGETSPEYQKQKEVVAQLSKEVESSSKAQEANANTMSRMRTQINNAATDINKTKSEISGLDSQMDKASASADDLNDSMGDTKGGADKLGNAVEDAGDKAERASNGGFTVLKGALANLAGNVIQSAISGIQGLVGDALDSSDALKKFESTMSFAGYDDSQIQTARDAMKDYADKTVYDLNTISNTTAQLAANGIEDYTGLTQAAGNLNAVAGGNADTFQSVAMVLTQTAGAGKLTTENWNQLANAIPGASGKIQEALQKNGAYTGNFRDAMAEGQITADEFNQAIMDLGYTDAAQEAATSTDTFEGAMGNMEAAVTDGLMQIYDAIGSENVTNFISGISDAVSEIVPYIKDAIQWLKDNLPTIAPLLATIAAGLGALMVAQQIDAMVQAFQKWKTATEGLTVAQRILNAVQLSSPIGIIIAAVAALVAGIVVLWNTNEGFRNFVIGAWENIKETVSNAVDSISTFFTSTVPNAIQTMVSWFQSLPQNIATFLSQVIGNVVNWATNMANKAEDAGSKFLSNVVGFVSQLPSRIATFLSNIISNVVAWATNMANNARNAGSKFLQNVVSFISQLPSKIAGALGQVISRLATWVGQMGAKGAEAARRLVSSVVSGLASLPSRVVSIGTNVVHGIWNGISSGLGWIKGKISGWVGNVMSFIKGLFGIHSPSTVMRDEVGKFLAMGIGVGFEQEMGNVTKQMQDSMPDPSSFAMSADVAYSTSGYQSSGYQGGGYSQMVDAFKEALAGMRIELDDEVAGRFVERTVANAIYAF